MTEIQITLKSIKFDDVSIVIRYNLNIPKNKDVTKEDIDELSSAYYNALNGAKKNLGLKDEDGWYVVDVEKASNYSKTQHKTF